jgi:hypothetical protein
MPFFRDVLSDVRYARRTLSRAPAFTLMEPLPYPEANRIVLVATHVGQGFSPADNRLACGVEPGLSARRTLGGQPRIFFQFARHASARFSCSPAGPCSCSIK